MPQVYADKLENGSMYGKKPDPDMRIETEVGEGRPGSDADKIVRAGSNLEP